MKRPVLNRKLVLEAAAAVPDGAGGLSKSWGVLGTLWADVQARTGRETFGPTGALALTGYRITLRGAPVGATNRPQPGQRLRDGARVYEILAVTEAERNGRFLICYANEELST